MPRATTLLTISLLLAACHRKPDQPATAAYVDPSTCATCHAAIAATYASTGMARSFYQPTSNPVEDYTHNNRYFHQPSNTWFQMLRRDGKFYQRRWQPGRESSADELQIDSVMGSGNHVRTYLHRTANNTLIELPLAWYPEHGGTWAMNPGYEGAHLETRRKVADECMFCHNGYPSPTGQLAEGIDCQRCHGPGSEHVKSPKPGTILNPAKLSPERQMDVCMQCHLQSTAAPLPSELRVLGRAPFSYNPAEPLTTFKAFFDKQNPSTGRDIEIVSSAYRLRQSQCFLKSAGKLVCETCHNPHAQAAADHYDEVCRTCHASAHQQTSMHDCASCHMPKRQTTDVVHATMTDHLIQRLPLPPSRPTASPYRGEVIPYYPAKPDALLLAAAQVINNSNLAQGILRLEAELAKNARPSRDREGAVALILGDAQRHSGNPTAAVQAYQNAATLDPKSSRALRGWAIALKESGQTSQAADVLRRAIQQAPGDAENWYERGLLDSEQGRTTDAIAELRKATELDPDLATAYNALGANLTIAGKLDEAEEAFQNALRIDPYEASTHSNRGRLLGARGAMPEAVKEFATATQMDPTNARNHYLYGLALANTGQTAAAAKEWKQAAAGNDPAAARDALQALRAR